MKAIFAVERVVHGKTGLFKTFHDEKGDFFVVFDQKYSHCYSMYSLPLGEGMLGVLNVRGLAKEFF
jgi:hypothetical protein